MSDLTRLRTFLEAFRAGSLSRAAERLSLSQPTATAHLQTLEGAVGKPLFERFPRGLKPTPAAEALARSIAPHLDALEQALREAKRARAPCPEPCTSPRRRSSRTLCWLALLWR